MGVDELLIQAAQAALGAMEDADSLLNGEGMQSRCEYEIKALKAALSPFLLTRERVLKEFFGDDPVAPLTGCETLSLTQTALPQNDPTFKVGERMGKELDKSVIIMVAPLHKGNLSLWLGVLNGVRQNML